MNIKQLITQQILIKQNELEEACQKYFISVSNNPNAPSIVFIDELTPVAINYAEILNFAKSAGINISGFKKDFADGKLTINEPSGTLVMPFLIQRDYSQYAFSRTAGVTR